MFFCRSDTVLHYLPIHCTVHCIALSPHSLYNTLYYIISLYTVQYIVICYFPVHCTIQCIMLSFYTLYILLFYYIFLHNVQYTLLVYRQIWGQYHQQKPVRPMCNRVHCTDKSSNINSALWYSYGDWNFREILCWNFLFKMHSWCSKMRLKKKIFLGISVVLEEFYKKN